MPRPDSIVTGAGMSASSSEGTTPAMINGVEGVSLDFRECSATLDAQPRKTILRDVSGQVTAGNILAIMGPSGAGKTTLLHLLCGVRGSSNETRSGTITLNGNRFTGQRTHAMLYPWSPQLSFMLRSLCKDALTLASMILPIRPS